MMPRALQGICAAFACLTLGQPLFAAEPDNQFIIQQQRQKALEQQLTPPTPDVRLSGSDDRSSQLIFPSETPCFLIARVTLSGQEALPHWLPLQRIANQAQGKCLGGKGVNMLMSALQNRLVDHGWITTRVLAPAQDLRQGTLALRVVPGDIRHVTLTPESSNYIQLYSAFPAREGNLLDLRDNKPTLINDVIQTKLDKRPKRSLPNANMGTAHAEIGMIQQAFDKGMTKGKNMLMSVSGERVGSYCSTDIVKMADKSGLKSLTIY